MTSTVITSYSTHLESKIILQSMSIFNSIISMEYIPKKLTYSNSKETMTFHLGTLFSRKHIRLNQRFLTQSTLLWSSCYTFIHHQTLEFFTILIAKSHMNNFPHTYIVVTLTKTSPIIIGVTINNIVQ